MARLSAVPDINVVRAFKGVLDFYEINGFWYVRKWPVIGRSTVLETNVNNVTRFAYFQRLSKLLDPYVIDAWRGQTRDTRWTWRDMSYRAFSAVDYNAAHQPDLLIPKNYPFPSVRSPFWSAYKAFYWLQDDRTDLIFFADALFPSVQLTFTNRPPLTHDVYKKRRGILRNCGPDLYMPRDALAVNLSSPSPLSDSNPLGCPDGLDLALHTASIEVWNRADGWLSPFTSQQSYMCLRNTRPDYAMPGNWDPFSSSFIFLFQNHEAALARDRYDLGDHPDPAFWPILPPDPEYLTRTKPYGRLNPGAVDDRPRVPYYNPHDWYEALPGTAWRSQYCETDCGIQRSDKAVGCLPDQNPQPPHVVSTKVQWFPVAQFPHPLRPHLLRWDGTVANRVARGVAMLGSPCWKLGFYPPQYCTPGDQPTFATEAIAGPCDGSLPANNTTRIQQVRVIHPADTGPGPRSTTFATTIPDYATIAALLPSVDSPPDITQDLWTRSKGDTTDSYPCASEFDWFYTASLFQSVIIVGPEHPLSFDGTGPDFLQPYGAQDYPSDGGSLSTQFFIWNSLGYFENGGAGLPAGELTPYASLLADPVLLSLGFIQT